MLGTTPLKLSLIQNAYGATQPETEHLHSDAAQSQQAPRVFEYEDENNAQ